MNQGTGLITAIFGSEGRPTRVIMRPSAEAINSDEVVSWQNFQPFSTLESEVGARQLKKTPSGLDIVLGNFHHLHYFRPPPSHAESVLIPRMIFFHRAHDSGLSCEEGHRPVVGISEGNHIRQGLLRTAAVM